MAFYSMHEGAGLASERAVPNAGGGLISQRCGTLLKDLGRKNGLNPLALTSRGRGLPGKTASPKG
jgi:hypothetical protein